MELNKKQKIAIIKLSTAMVEADGKISVREPYKIDSVLKGLEINSKAEQMNIIESSKKIALLDAVHIISNFTIGAKKRVISLLRSIMKVDGDADDKEISLLNFVSSLLGLPIQDAELVCEEN